MKYLKLINCCCCICVKKTDKNLAWLGVTWDQALFFFFFFLLLCFFGSRGKKITPSSRERHKRLIGRARERAWSQARLGVTIVTSLSRGKEMSGHFYTYGWFFSILWNVLRITDCRPFSVLKTLTGYRPYSHSENRKKWPTVLLNVNDVHTI